MYIKNKKQTPSSSVFICLCLLLLLLLASCGANTGLSQLASTTTSRKGQLGQRLDVFSKAVYWGSAPEIAAMVTPETRQETMFEMKKKRRTQRLVDFDLQDVEYNDDATSATVEYAIRYYEQPTYYVRTRVERQQWVYHRLGGGWLYRDAEIISDGIDRKSAPDTAARGRLGREAPEQRMR